jgi:hypothetical protein
VGDRTYVDFERGLNKAINRLREALSDSAEAPRYLETVPKRGYRFLAPLERPAAAQPATAPTSQVSLWRYWVAGVVIIGAILVIYGSRHRRLSEHETVVLADFDNRTGDKLDHAQAGSGDRSCRIPKMSGSAGSAGFPTRCG